MTQLNKEREQGTRDKEQATENESAPNREGLRLITRLRAAVLRMHPMSLDHPILGCLKQERSAGYQLNQRVDATVRHFWPAEQAQIYRTLARVTANEWVVSDVVVQQGKPNHKRYSLTRRGAAELTRWLRAPFEPFGQARGVAGTAPVGSV